MDLPQIPRLAAWPEHRCVLARAIEHFQNDPRVPGILLGGSFASGSPDFYSDVDLYIVVRDEHFADLLAEKETAAAAAGRVLAGFVPDHLGPGGDEMYIALYDGPVKLDFNYVRQSTVKPNWNLTNRLVLKDASGNLGSAIRTSAGMAPPPPSRETLEALHNKFWTWCWYVFGKIARGELWEALDGIHALRSLALVPIAEWDAGRPPEGHRRLEARLDDHVRARLAATVSTLDRTALYGALQAEIHLFRELQAHVWPRYGLPIDARSGHVIEQAIDRAWVTAPHIHDSAPAAAIAALMRGIVRIFETGDVARAVALIDAEYIDHQGLAGTPLRGTDGFKRVVAAVHTGVSDLRVTTEDLIAEGDRVVARLRRQGTRSGGGSIDRETVDIVRFANGRAVEHWGAVVRDDEGVPR